MYARSVGLLGCVALRYNKSFRFRVFIFFHVWHGKEAISFVYAPVFGRFDFRIVPGYTPVFQFCCEAVNLLFGPTVSEHLKQTR